MRHSKLEQAARSALEALREYRDTQMIQAPRKAITALREALAEQAEQEPVAWLVDAVPIEGKPSAKVGFPFATSSKETVDACIDGIHIVTPLYAAPVSTKDLTDDEIMQTYTNFNLNELGEQSFMIGFARAVIVAYREKNK